MSVKRIVLLVLPCALLLSACDVGHEDELAAAREETSEWRGKYESLVSENEELYQQVADLGERVRDLEAGNRALAQEAAHVDELQADAREQQEEIRTLKQRLEDMTPAGARAGSAPAGEAVHQRLERLGTDLFEQGEYGSAHAVLLSAHELGVDGPSVLYPLAFCEASFGELEEADRRYAECRAALEAQQEPERSLLLRCLNNHALVLSRLGRPEEAAGMLRRAVELDESFAPAQFNLGLLYAQKLDRPADAIESLRQHVAHGGSRSVSARRLIRNLQGSLEEPQTAPNAG